MELCYNITPGLRALQFGALAYGPDVLEIKKPR